MHVTQAPAVISNPLDLTYLYSVNFLFLAVTSHDRGERESKSDLTARYPRRKGFTVSLLPIHITYDRS